MTKNRIVNCLIIVTFIAAFVTGCGGDDEKTVEANHLSRASAYVDQGQYKAATIEYRNAIKKSKGGATAVLAYTDMLLRVGQYAAVVEMLTELSEDKNAHYFENLIRAYHGMHKYRSAEQILEQARPTLTPLTYEKLYGQTLLGQGELGRAKAVYDEALSKQGNDYELVLGKASVLVRTGDVNGAKALLNSIPSGEDAYVRAQILLTGVAIQQNQLESAEEILTGILSQLSNTDIMEPEKAVVLERLSYVLTRQGRSNEAYIYTKLLSEAFPGSNEVKEQYKTAVEKLQAGQTGEAKELLKKILAEYPSYDLATQLLGVISYLEGDNESASKYLSESVDPEVANEITTNIYAATNLKLNDPQKVLEILGPSIEQTKMPETLALYGVAAISAKQYKKGEAALLKALEIDSENVRVRLALADFYRNKSVPDHNNEWKQLSLAYDTKPSDILVLKEVVRFRMENNGLDDAFKFAQDNVKKHPKSYEANLMAGFVLLQKQDQKSALKYFTSAESVATASNDKAKALIAQGRTFTAMQDFEKAKARFERVIELFPKVESGYAGLLNAYIQSGGAEQGVSKLEAYAQKNNVVSPYMVMIRSAISRQDIEQANKWYSKAEGISDDKASLRYIANAIKYVEAVSAAQKGEIALAREKVAEILIDEPNNIRLLALMVDLEIKSNHLNEARKIVAQVEKLNNTKRIVALLKGEIAYAEKAFEEAREFYSSAWNDSPHDLVGDKLYLTLGMLSDNEGQRKHLEKWLKLIPNSSKALMYKAIAYQQRGQRIKAIENYEKALKLDSNNVISLNNLGWIYFEKDDYVKSLELLKKANELAPNNAAILDSYGWVLFKSGEKQQGVEMLEKALALAPNAKEIEEHLNEAKK